MKLKSLLPLLLLVLFFSIALPVEGANAKEQFGRPLTITTVTKVSEIDKNPRSFVGKKVLIRGTVVEVCAKRGCWMDIASDTPYGKFQAKVVDGVIVFPMSARGKVARVEGIVEELKMSREEALAYHRHHAEEKGLPFDPATVKGPETTYRLQAQGAVLE
jgi:hypothetical protein